MMHSTAEARTRRAGPGRKPAAQAVSLAALQLLGRWQRVCRGCLSFTNGCACGFGASVDLTDLDDLIVDHLQRKFEGVDAVARFLATQGTQATQGAPEGRASGCVKNLLRALAVAPEEITLAEAHDLLQAIEASVASLEEQNAM